MAESGLDAAARSPAPAGDSESLRTMNREKNMDSLAVTVKNGTDQVLFIDGDPNWDDQVLTIDGTPQEQIYGLAAGSSAVVGITADYNEMGVIFATTRNYDYGGGGFYQLTIGPSDDGNLGVTDGGPNGSPTVQYTLADQAPLSMTMTFTNG
jgi:hypothetical protein